MQSIITQESRLDKVISLLLKWLWPPFHNRITRTVIVIGGVIAASPLWERLVEFALKYLNGMDLEQQTQPWWGVVLIVAALIYNYGFHRLKSQEQRISEYVKVEEMRIQREDKAKADESDKIVAQRFLAICSEESLQSALSWIGSDHSYFKTAYDAFEAFEYFGKLIENKFINERVETAASMFYSHCGTLTTFLAQHFFMMHRENQFYLYPELNCDRRGNGTSEQEAQYGRYVNELMDILTRTQQSYSNVRSAIRHELLI